MLREILLVEDNPHDSFFTVEAFAEAGVDVKVNVVKDGVEALLYLHREAPFEEAPRPDLILLDLNLPRMDGRELLADIKKDVELLTIPVVVLTTSRADLDIQTVYRNYGNSYVVKPIDFTSFVDVARSIDDFWFHRAILPS